MKKQNNPFAVTVAGNSLLGQWTLSGEHFAKVIQLLMDCHSLDSAKERLLKAVDEKKRKAEYATKPKRQDASHAQEIPE